MASEGRDGRPLIQDALLEYGALFLLGHLAFLVGCAAQATKRRWISCALLPVIVWTMTSCGQSFASDSVGLTLALGALLTYWPLRALDLFVLAPWNGEPAPWRLDERADRDQARGWLELADYAWALSTSFRGIGWNWQVQKGRTAGGHARWSRRWRWSARRWMHHGLPALMTFDSCSAILAASPLAGLGRHSRWSDMAYTSRLQYVLVFGLTAASAIQLVFVAYECTAVALDTWDPAEIEAFPLTRLSSADSVRAFWGRGWHQLFRRIFVGTGGRLSAWATAAVLPRRWALTLGAFMTSSLMHHAAVLAVDGKTSYATVGSFMVQPVGMLMESAMQKSTLWGPTTGRIWMLLFLAISFEPMVGEWLDKGLVVDTIPVNLSPASAILHALQRQAPAP